MIAIFMQWWHSRVLRHDQELTEVYNWPIRPVNRYEPDRVIIRCQCGAVWIHSA